MLPTVIIQYHKTSFGDDTGGGRADFCRSLCSLQPFLGPGSELVVVKPHAVGGDEWIKTETRRWGIRSARLVSVPTEVHADVTEMVLEVGGCLSKLRGPLLVCEGKLRVDPMSFAFESPRGDAWVVCRESVRMRDLHFMRSRTERLKPSEPLYGSAFLGLCGFRSFRVFEEAVMGLETEGEEEITLPRVARELRRNQGDVYIHRVLTPRPVGIYRVQSVESSACSYRTRLRHTA